MSLKGTFFYDELSGKRLGSDDDVVPIPLYKGMIITIHSYDEVFEVTDWQYHHGHPDEEAGLKIWLKALTKDLTEDDTTAARKILKMNQ